MNQPLQSPVNIISSAVLSEKNYPELYEKWQALVKRVEKDFPNEKFPKVEILNDGWSGAHYVPEIGKTPEAIQISREIVEKLPQEQILAILLHEVGHDAKNHYKRADLKKEEIIDELSSDPRFADFSPSNPEQMKSLEEEYMKRYSALLRKHEFEADDFVKKYGFASHLAKALEALEAQQLKQGTLFSSRMTEKIAPELDDHPPTEKRIKRLQDKEVILDLGFAQIDLSGISEIVNEAQKKIGEFMTHVEGGLNGLFSPETPAMDAKPQQQQKR